MDYALIRETLKQWVKDVTGCPARWENDPAGLQLKLPAHFVLTGPMNVEPVGEDCVEWHDAGPGSVQAAVVGWREFDVMARCVVRSQDPIKSAQYQLERLRTALARPSTREVFDAGHFAVLDMSKSVQFDAPFEERFESVASATLRCTAVVDEAAEDTDGRDAAVPALTAVRAASKIKGEDNADLPASLNPEDHEISGG